MSPIGEFRAKSPKVGQHQQIVFNQNGLASNHLKKSFKERMFDDIIPIDENPMQDPINDDDIDNCLNKIDNKDIEKVEIYIYKKEHKKKRKKKKRRDKELRI